MRILCPQLYLPLNVWLQEYSLCSGPFNIKAEEIQATATRVVGLGPDW